MFQLIKISCLIILFFITNCDDSDHSRTDAIKGCTNSTACNYNPDATSDDASCELNLFCYDSDGDGLGYGDSTQICLDEIPDGWVVYCNDPEDDCDGIKDDCGECNGNNQNKDCMDVCFGTNILDNNDICCENTKIQNFSTYNTCLPDEFKWSLTITATSGTYNNDIFTPSSTSDSLTIGTHYLSTDGLDLLVDITGNTYYNDVPQQPTLGVENLIYFYTSHPEWEYYFGDILFSDFTREYKLHDIEVLSNNGIYWNGEMTSNFSGERFIKISFELESEQNINSKIIFNFNDHTNPTLQTICDEEFFFSNSDLDVVNACNIIREDFEYIIPITFQGAGHLTPFNISIYDTYIY